MPYNHTDTGSPNERELTPEEYRLLKREIEEKRMAKKLSECPYCKRPADERGGINHVGGCTGLQEIFLNRLQYDGLQTEITHLRGNLSLAEEGLASAMQEIKTLHAGRDNAQLINDNGAKEIERLRAIIFRIKEARLDWSMVCECTCGACETFSSAIWLIGRSAVEPTPNESSKSS